MLNFHTRSVYSYKKSIAKIEDIIKKSKEQGETSFCITDYGSLTSFVKAFSLASKHNMKFIPGCEFLLKPEEYVNSFSIKEKINLIEKEMRLKRTTKEMYANYEKEIQELKKIKSVEEHSIIILAKNEEGFKSLINIYNHSNLENDKFLITKEIIEANKEGLIILSGGIYSDILYYIRIGNNEKAKHLLENYKNIFGENFYAQIEYQKMKKQKGFIDEVESYNTFIELAQELDIEFVATNSVKYVNLSDRAHYRLFENVMSSHDVVFYQDNGHLIEEDELKSLMLKVYPEDVVLKAFENIRKIENQCEKIKEQKAEPLVNCEEELIRLCQEGWERKRKGTKYEQESKERLAYELSVINSKNFSQYFIKVITIIKLAKELGILIGPGRGSGCGSEICYLIGIIDVDPLKYNLFFERFLNPERNGFPDIDIDMSSVPDQTKNYKIKTPIGIFNKTDIITTKSHGDITALQLYTMIQNGDEIEV